MNKNTDYFGACYLCGSIDIFLRKGEVRDNPMLKIAECHECALVFLYPRQDINEEHYRSSGMHGAHLPSITEWQKITASDDQRRFTQFTSLIGGKKILDFGCGNGGFLLRAETHAAQVTGVEPENRITRHFEKSLDVVPCLEVLHTRAEKFDVITAFHVMEHLSDPISVLSDLKKLLAPGGCIVIEVPNAEDALLTLYESADFQKYTYWSQHLFLFNAHTLALVAARSGLTITAIEHHQRYPLSNHLHWLSKGKGGGHQKWSFLDSTELHEAYAHALAKIGKTDTIIAFLK